MAGLIYKIENLVNGKVYIGQTRQSFRQRKAEHLTRLRAEKRQHRLYAAFRKYGVDNFAFTKLASVPNDENLDQVEIDLIAQFDSFRNGYNCNAGGESLSQETRDKISKAMKGREITWSGKAADTRKRLYGVAHKMGNGGVGEKSRHAKSFEVRSPDGEIIVFKGLRQFCRERELSHNLLLATLKGEQSHHKGYVLLKRFND